jgi:hypothetical protein
MPVLICDPEVDEPVLIDGLIDGLDPMSFFGLDMADMAALVLPEPDPSRRDEPHLKDISTSEVSTTAPSYTNQLHEMTDLYEQEQKRTRTTARPNGKTRRARNAKKAKESASETSKNDGDSVLEEDIWSNNFFMFEFKCRWCPIKYPHSWPSCPAAHTYKDWRRSPSLGYGSSPCTAWEEAEAKGKDGTAACPNGILCPFAHGAKEQYYHPAFFKTVICREGENCPRGGLCAFYHNPQARRSAPA